MSKTVTYQTEIVPGTFTNPTITVSNQGAVLGISNGAGVFPALIAVAFPNNANAAAAGVPLYGFYVNALDPAIVYQRRV
jgi:hypothetical protein